MGQPVGAWCRSSLPKECDARPVPLTLGTTTQQELKTKPSEGRMLDCP